MILVFNLDDPKVLNEAYTPQKYPSATYGVAWCFVPEHDYTRIGRTEDLFITAHGNEVEIGNKGSGLDYTAEAFADMLHKKFLPEDYQGTIYLSACDSAPTFHKKVCARLKAKHNSVKVKGVRGKVGMSIAAPDSATWEAA